VNDVRDLVDVRWADRRRNLRSPFDGDDGPPRPPSHQHLADFESQHREEPEETLEPAAERLTAVPLAPEWMLARKDVVDVRGGAVERHRVIPHRQPLEAAANHSRDDGVIHTDSVAGFRRNRELQVGRGLREV
jgi:hypothetical protein